MTRSLSCDAVWWENGLYWADLKGLDVTQSVVNRCEWHGLGAGSALGFSKS
jgi:hypothetical protein